MIRTKKLFSTLFAATFCAAVACTALPFVSEPLSAHAAENHAREHTEWTELETNTAITGDGQYYLSGPLNRDIVISDGNVEICLNGNTLTGT